MLSLRHNIHIERQRGFSLIEMLISLTVVSMIMLLMASGLKLISSSWDRNVTRLESQDTYNRLAALFYRDVEGIRRIVERNRTGMFYNFSGNEATLSFVTREPAYPSKPGLYSVEYSRLKQLNDVSLIRRRRPYMGQQERNAAVSYRDKVTLLQGGYSYRFSYAELQKGRIVWLKEWKQSDALPKMIRLSVSYKNKPVSAALIARVRIEAEHECISQSSNLCSLRKTGAKEAGRNRAAVASGALKQ